MIDSPIVSEGLVREGEPGWQVTLSDGATFIAYPPSGSTSDDGTWTVGIRLAEDGAQFVFWSSRRTLVAALSESCEKAAYEGRTAHVVAALTVNLT